MKETVITYRMDNNMKTGVAYFGIFPKHELQHPSGYTTIKMTNDHFKEWKVTIESVTLKYPQNKQTIDTALSNLPAIYRLSLSSKILIVPKALLQSLVNLLDGCSLEHNGV